MTRLLLLAALLLTVSVAPAWGQYSSLEIPCNGIDDDNSAGLGLGVDLYNHAAGDGSCSGLNKDDKDNDGYTTAQGDCDDTNTRIFPGQWTPNGCTTGQVRKCDAGGAGTYGTCRVFSSTDCENTGSGGCYCIDPVSGNNSNDGILDAAPSCWKTFNPISGGCASGTCRTPVAGDTYYVRQGTISDAVNSTSFPRARAYFVNNDGTSSNRIVVKAWPGETWTVDSPDQAAPDYYTMYLRQNNYWDFEGGIVTGGFGQAMRVESTAGQIRIRRMWMHHNNGDSNNNPTPLFIQNGASDVEVSNSVFTDPFPTVNSGPGALIKIFTSGSTGVYIHHNVGTTIDRTKSVEGFNNKHGWNCSGCSYVLKMEGNQIINLPSFPMSMISGTSFIQNNLFVGNSSGVWLDGGAGGPGGHGPLTVSNNTWVNQPVMFLDNSASTDFTGAITWEDNVYSDTVTASGSIGQIVRIDTYAADSYISTYQSILTFRDNCYYAANLSGLTNAFDWFSATGTGRNIGALYSFAGWQNTVAQDTGSVEENPGLDSAFLATSTNCSGKGYAAYTGGAVTTTTTSTTSTSTSTTSTTSTTAVPPQPFNKAFNRPRFYKLAR